MGELGAVGGMEGMEWEGERARGVLTACFTGRKCARAFVAGWEGWEGWEVRSTLCWKDGRGDDQTGLGGTLLGRQDRAVSRHQLHSRLPHLQYKRWSS